MKKTAISQLRGDDLKLVEAAREATSISYSPYSNFKVGAAVLLGNGAIIKGANQENASYPVGICAERSTLATAQNLYPDIPVTAIALAATNASGTYTSETVTPCGMCRQAIAECENRYKRNIRIIMTSSEDAIITESVKELLPLAFS